MTTREVLGEVEQERFRQEALRREGKFKWSRSDRPRIDTHPLQGKLRWVAS